MIVGPASHRLYPTSIWRRLLRRPETDREPLWIRPVFTLYRRAVFETARFADFKDVGGISRAYLEAGRARLLPPDEVIPYVFHLGGTTRLSNLDHRKKAKRKKARQHAAFLRRPEIRPVLAKLEESE
jgi:hypothetical protein